MINYKIILKVLGSLVILEAVMFVSCLILGFSYGERQWTDFGIPAILATVIGISLLVLGRKAENRMSRRDGFLSVSLSWIMFCIVGTMPFLISGYEPRFAAAFFETMSGFTTTGATVLNNIDQLPHSLLLWRSITHWFGGMGIVFFTIAILPTMGTGDLKLFSAEASGLKLDKLHPRISTTARWILVVYMALTLSCIVAYHLGGMTAFDAVNHAFSTVATGGFSTHQASFAYFHSPRLELIASVFMILSGINFSLLYLLIIKRRFKKVFTDGEVRYFLTIAFASTLIIAALLFSKNTSASSTPCARPSSTSPRSKPPLVSPALTLKCGRHWPSSSSCLSVSVEPVPVPPAVERNACVWPPPLKSLSTSFATSSIPAPCFPCVSTRPPSQPALPPLFSPSSWPIFCSWCSAPSSIS